jgi:hypothetical protein
MVKRLDLQQDFGEIYEYVIERVRSFDPATNDGPGDSGPVTFMEFGFAFDQSGWVVLVFDTRPEAEPDGEWNFYIDKNKLDRPHWRAAFDANRDWPVRLVLPDGTERKLPPRSRREFATALGDLLKDILLKARSEGVFENLLKAPRCYLGVEEQEGGYGWPVYEERGQDDLV